MSEPTFTESEIDAIRAELGDWYDRHRRDLPWRGIDDPYKTWVAEIMLQQTQVATVVDYYRHWLERFPTVEDVAGAEVDEVLEMWEGLGYYRRARYLHRSARKVVDEYGGELPDSAEKLEDLTGIGPYTAGAIASIAFGEATPVVDGNVARVLSRLRAIGGDPKSTENKKLYWRLADRLVDPQRPGDFNQAMMELGATVCVPSTPNCLLCPVREQCRGFQQGEPERYPDTASRATQKPMSVATCLVVNRHPEGAETLVSKRPAEGLLGGLWEFPTVELDDETPGREAVDGLLEEQYDLTHWAEASTRQCGEFTHHFSHIKMSVSVSARIVTSDERRSSGQAAVEERGGGWWPVEDLQALAMSAAMRRVEEHLAPIVDGHERGDGD